MENSENISFPDWLKAKMKEEGRKYKWLSEKVGLKPFTLNYKVKTDTFTYEEENKIKKILE